MCFLVVWEISTMPWYLFSWSLFGTVGFQYERVLKTVNFFLHLIEEYAKILIAYLWSYCIMSLCHYVHFDTSFLTFCCQNNKCRALCSPSRALGARSSSTSFCFCLLNSDRYLMVGSYLLQSIGKCKQDLWCSGSQWWWMMERSWSRSFWYRALV